jgi:hypothetical protein
MGEHRLSVRAARRAIRYDPGIIKRPRDAANLLRIVGRASRGLLRRER